MIQLELPWPPSVNTYWRHVGHQVKLSAKGREYKHTVASLVRQRGLPLTGRLAVDIELQAPTRAKRDVDNFAKGILDALQYAGVFLDDEQVDHLVIRRGPVISGGLAIVKVDSI